MLGRFFAIASLLPGLLLGTELIPWYGRDLQIETRFSYLYQWYNAFDGHTSNDNFYTFSVLLPYDSWCGELETTLNNSSWRNFAFDDLCFTGRYRWLDDIVGDPITLTTGATVTAVFNRGRHNPGSFHHGNHFEAEIHAAIGKERSCQEFWLSRWWAIAGAGLADTGSPWIRADAAWETNYCQIHHFRLFADSLWGLGDRSVHKHFWDFDGYGSVDHQSIDLGTRYSYLICDSDITLSLQYSYRIFAKNYPSKANRFMLRILYPFGL